MLHVHSGRGMLISRTAKRPSRCVADHRGLGFESDGEISAETGVKKGVKSSGSCCTQNAKTIQLGLTLPLVLPLRRATVPSAVWPEPSLQGLLVPPTKARQLVAVRECRGDTRWRQRRETSLGTKGSCHRGDVVIRCSHFSKEWNFQSRLLPETYCCQ